MADNGKTSKAMGLANEGAFLAAYTKNSWFVKIKPAFNIDKALFSFVKKGDAASEHFDVYMDADILDTWFDDLLSDNQILQRTLAGEAQAGEKYPKGYKYVTGENGEKSVGLVQSQTAGAITVNGKNGGTYANVPVPTRDFKAAAKRYQVAYRKRIEELANATVASSTKWRDNHPITDVDEPRGYYENAPMEQESVSQQPVQPTQPTQPAAQSGRTDVQVHNAKTTAAPMVCPNAQEYLMFKATSEETAYTTFVYHNSLRVPESILNQGGSFSCVGDEMPQQNYFLVKAFT